MSDQALLNSLTQKVLRPVRYDCGGGVVLYRGPKQEPTMAASEQDNGPAPSTGLTM